MLRFYSPMHTIGGGAVLEPHAAKHRRFDPAVLENLAVKEQGTPEELLEEAVQRIRPGPIAAARIAPQLGLPLEAVREVLERLKAEGRLIATDGEAVLHAAHRGGGREPAAGGAARSSMPVSRSGSA